MKQSRRQRKRGWLFWFMVVVGFYVVLLIGLVPLSKVNRDIAFKIGLGLSAPVLVGLLVGILLFCWKVFRSWPGRFQSLLSRLRGNREPVGWKKLATDIEATCSWKKNYGSVHANNYKGWTIILTGGRGETYLGGGYSFIGSSCRINAPYRSKDDLMFSIQRRSLLGRLFKHLKKLDNDLGYPDINRNFKTQSNNELKIRELFANPRIRQLIQCLPCPGTLETTGYGQQAELRFEREWDIGEGGFIRESKRLKCLFDLFAEMLDQLCNIGSAERKQMK